MGTEAGVKGKQQRAKGVAAANNFRGEKENSPASYITKATTSISFHTI
jgi:hypothetical protein